jgi:hypothetical protein
MIEFNAERHEYTKDGEIWRSVTQIISNVFGHDKYEKISGEKLEIARERGLYVHYCCQLYDMGELDIADVDPEYLPWLQCWINFRKDTGFIPLDNERVVCHEALRYCGTLDKRGVLFGEMALIDLKVVATVFEREARMQTAGYALAIEDVLSPRYVVQLRPNAKAKLYPFRDKTDFLGWRSLVSVDNWLRSQGYDQAK